MKVKYLRMLSKLMKYDRLSLLFDIFAVNLILTIKRISVDTYNLAYRASDRIMIACRYHYLVNLSPSFDPHQAELVLSVMDIYKKKSCYGVGLPWLKFIE